jgi:hypothetical protein
MKTNPYRSLAKRFSILAILAVVIATANPQQVRAASCPNTFCGSMMQACFKVICLTNPNSALCAECTQEVNACLCSNCDIC